MNFHEEKEVENLSLAWMIPCSVRSLAGCLQRRQVKQLGIPSPPDTNPSNFRYAVDWLFLLFFFPSVNQGQRGGRGVIAFTPRK